MNGFIKKSFAVLCIGGAAAVGGCCSDCKLCNLYDNCWLERNSYQAAQSVDHTFGAQVNNGHVLDQTLFVYDFETGTDLLTKGGIERLKYLARRRPEPDSKIYLQTAQDVEFDLTVPERYAATRSELDAKRVAAMQKFLQADTAGRGLSFAVTTIDVPTPGIAARPIGVALQKNYAAFQGTLPAGGFPGSTPPPAGSGGSPAGGGGGAPPQQ
jgi:hypothetical protein